ncbi:hypothetical protein DFH09DRAFT_1432403 [Mycena vulgaris]|nr:hypothetical protein DFH09DRAFT_1432403 [Mycena vulgaris]
MIASGVFILCNIIFLRACLPLSFLWGAHVTANEAVQARFPKLPKPDDIGRRDGLSASGLTSASWIWASAPITGNVAFLKTITTPPGRTASSATITISAVNRYTLWVNGHPIGASGHGADDWKLAQVFGAVLAGADTTFSVLAVNDADSGAPAPGLVATIHIKFDDGSADAVVVSDSTWTVSSVIPSDFPTPSNTSQFAAATVAAPFGSGPWGTNVTVAFPDPNTPTLAGSEWIWSTPGAATNTTPTTVVFRKTFTTPSGRSPQSATVLITVDDGYIIYLNGDYIASATSNTFTVIAKNLPRVFTAAEPSPAGVLAAIRIQYSDGGSDVVRTDSSWLSTNFTSVAAVLSAPDSELFPTFAIGRLGDMPWGPLDINSNTLAAAEVPSSPFASGIAPQPSAADEHAAPTSTDGQTVPIALIVGPIIGGLTLIVGGLAIFLWRRRRNNRIHVRPWKSLDSPGIPRADMASVESQGATSREGPVRAPYPTVVPYPLPQAITIGGHYPKPLGIMPPTKLEADRSTTSRGPTNTTQRPGEMSPSGVRPPSYVSHREILG